MSNPTNQHIVSACLLRQFTNKKDEISKDIEILKERFIQDRNEIPSNACYKILREDFNKNNSFVVRKKNIIKPENKGFCERNLYSINTDVLREFLKSKDEVDSRSDNDIKFLLEKWFGQNENDFGKAIKYWNENEKNVDIKNFISEYKNTIINFVISNELRGKNFYKNLERKEKFNSKISDYKKFDQLYFFSFLLFNFNNIIDNLDSYEMVEAINAAYTNSDAGFGYSHLVEKKMHVFNSLENANQKNLVLIKNDSGLNFLISDSPASVFYKNNRHFRYIFDLIGADNFNVFPEKITLMPIKRNLLAIVSDSEFNENHMIINDKEYIRNVNALLYSRTNEWVVLDNVLLKRSEIINEKVLKKIKGDKYLSNFANWYEAAASNESYSYSNEKYGYLKIEKSQYNRIKELFKCLFSMNGLTINLKRNQYFELNLKDKRTVNHCKSSQIFIGVTEGAEQVLIFKDRDFYNAMCELTEIQSECFNYMLRLHKFASYFIIREEYKDVLFFLNAFKMKTNVKI